jgi:hypothetical protein
MVLDERQIKNQGFLAAFIHSQLEEAGISKTDTDCEIDITSPCIILTTGKLVPKATQLEIQRYAESIGFVVEFKSV